MSKELKTGYTTGACAAAALKAALLFYVSGGKNIPANITLTALDGTILHIPVQNITYIDDGAKAEVIKYSGDDPDITNGITVITEVKPLAQKSGINFVAGCGVGRVTKPGLSLPPGEAAINPGPRKLMTNVVTEILGENPALQITISLPGGEELAKRTLNPI